MGELGVHAHQVGVHQAGIRAEYRQPPGRRHLIGVGTYHEHSRPIHRCRTVELLVVEQRIEFRRGRTGRFHQAGLRGHGIGQRCGGRDPPGRCQQRLRGVRGHLGRGGGVARQHNATVLHPSGQSLGRIVEDLVVRTVAQGLGIEHVGEHVQVRHQWADPVRVDGPQYRGADGHEPQQPVVIGHRHPRRQQRRAARGGGPQRSFVGGGHDDLGAAFERAVHGADEARIARVVPGHQDGVEWAHPLRNRGCGDDRQSGALTQRGHQQRGGALGPARARDEYHAARGEVVKARERILIDGGGSGTHLGATRCGRTQCGAGVGGFQRSGVIEVEYRCPCDHRVLPPPLANSPCDSTIPVSRARCSESRSRVRLLPRAIGPRRSGAAAVRCWRRAG